MGRRTRILCRGTSWSICPAERRPARTRHWGWPEGRFEVRACGNGLNGPRLYAWAMIATASSEHFLVIRRAVDGGPDLAAAGESGAQGARDGEDGEATRNPSAGKLPPGTGFVYCHVPKSSPIDPSLSNLLLMIGRRWPIEETIAVGKGPLGWDHNQFRKYESIQRHNALSGAAMLRANLLRKGVEEASQFSDAAGSGGAAIPEQAVAAISGSSVVARFPMEDT
jgi:hypothetical protein